MLQDSTLLADLHMLCGQTHAGAQRPVAHHPVSPACNLAKACSHVFGTVIRGIAGSFSRCVPYDVTHSFHFLTFCH